MAGAPVKRGILQKLEDNAKRDSSPDAPIETALDWVCYQIESGETLTSIAKEMDVNRATVRTSLANRFGEDVVKARLEAARHGGGADAQAEKTIERSQNITDKDDAAAAREENSSRRWLAGRWNREAYGEQRGQQQGVNVNLNFGSLLVQAHRQIEAMDNAPALPPAETVVDAEVIDDPQGEGRVQGDDGVGPTAQQEAKE